MRRRTAWVFILVTGIASVASAEENLTSRLEVEASLDIADVPSGFPVGFCLLTEGQRQYVAYYDKDRNMTVAMRTLDSEKWHYHMLPSKVGWDSHNGITMTADDDGYLHLSGNMHVSPLNYFRSSKPWDVMTFERITAMTGEKETQCTYPKFMRDADNRLIFNYRAGGSGNGNEIYKVYDLKTQSWKGLHDGPLIDGQGDMNAYCNGPRRGPDGWFHMIWVWRDTPDCATNHHLSYARSKDIIHWESVSGEKITLPITIHQTTLWVDPVPSGGGIINGCHKLAFDSVYRPILTYHKSDANGNMQVYASRFEDGKWVQHVLTGWSQPVTFSGRGSMRFIGLRISGLSRVGPGTLSMTYRHRDYGSGRLVIDEQTLRPIDKKITIPEERYPEEMNQPRIAFNGIEIRRQEDIGHPEAGGTRYVLQWETLGANQDRPRNGPLPEPSRLRLYQLSAGD